MLHRLLKLVARTNGTRSSIGAMVVEPDLFDPHTTSHEKSTLAQLTLFILWLGSIIYYIIQRRKRNQPQENHVEKDSDSEKSLPKVSNSSKPDDHAGHLESGVSASATTEFTKASALSPEPTLETFLQYLAVFGFIMIFFYLCDYKKTFHILDKEYDRDIFLFLVFIFFLVACCFTIKPTSDAILSRDQTEEWKGWMQVMFVWYHYFAAKEWYNWIRVYIACYVWMTGFGNFSFFWVKRDFSIWRMAKMLFRLNFLVIVVCLVTDNEYILYYICAMHTYWFLTVYFFMRILSSWNQDRCKMVVKFGAYAIFNALLFEIPNGVAIVFRPLWFIFQYHDGKHDIMHEWQFRLGLDHWACLVGMLCAYNYPHFKSLLQHLEDPTGSFRDKTYKKIIRIGMIIMSIMSLVIWYFSFMRLDKLEYNKLHPYTSFVPILAYIVLRNSFPVLRKYHVHMFAWLGKITLETYLSQLHIYLQSNAKDLLGYFFWHSNDYRLLNFSLSTIIYLAMSYALFKITNIFSAFLIQKDTKKCFRFAAVGAISFMASLGIAAVAKFSYLFWR